MLSGLAVSVVRLSGRFEYGGRSSNSVAMRLTSSPPALTIGTTKPIGTAVTSSPVRRVVAVRAPRTNAGGGVPVGRVKPHLPTLSRSVRTW